MTHLEHVGIAVSDPEAAIRLFERLLGVRPYKQERVALEGVQTHFLAAGSTKLELLEALGPDSPVARYLAKRGEGLHHLAFDVEDIDAQMQHVRAHGFTPLSEAPRPGADGKLIFFLHPKETLGVLIEFCQNAPAPLPATSVAFRGEHLAVYERGGHGQPPLVVLHGAGGATALETAPLIRRLEPHFRVLALDFAAHGGSASYDAVPLSIDFLADNVLGMLDALDLDAAHLFGFSLGGYVALHVALRHPDRVGRLAVHGTNIVWDAPLVAAMQARLDVAHITTRYPAVAQRLEATHPDWPRLFARIHRMVADLPTRREPRVALHRIAQPILVSAVDRDDLFPLDATLSLHRTLPNSTLAILPGTRHALETLDPALYAPLLVQHFGA